MICPGCNNEFEQTGRNHKRCAKCAKERHRALEREAKANVERFVPEPESFALNCLNCAFCQLQKDTDFTKRGTVIFCNAPRREMVTKDAYMNTVPKDEVVGRKPVNLRGCPQAQEMPKNGPNQVWSHVAIEYLRSHYDHTSKNDLVAALKINWGAIRIKAHRLGINGKRAEKFLSQGGKATLGKLITWTEQQKEYLYQAYCDDSVWPTLKIAPSLRQEENEKRRAIILANLAERGGEKTWQAVEQFVVRQFKVRAAKKKREYENQYKRKSRAGATALSSP